VKALSPRDPRFRQLSDRITALGPGLPLSWRRAVARPPVENCEARFELLCPQRWDALARTDTPGARFCDVCRRSVYYASNMRDAPRLALSGECVAIDVDPETRYPGDLDRERHVTAGMIAPPRPR